MGAVIKSQGTELYWASGPTAVTKAVCITSVSGLGGAREQLEVTCMDDTQDKAYESGLGSPSPVTVGFNIHKDELSHEALLALKATGAVVSFGIYGSDAVTAPTAVASVMQAVTGRVSMRFSGYVSDINIDIQSQNIWRGTVTIQRSGAVIFDLTPT